jgi:hypothetical protein
MVLPGLPYGASPPPDEHLWTLRKGRLTAECFQALHPLGLELRLAVNGDTVRTGVARSVEEARAESQRMRDALYGRGWR